MCLLFFFFTIYLMSYRDWNYIYLWHSVCHNRPYMRDLHCLHLNTIVWQLLCFVTISFFYFTNKFYWCRYNNLWIEKIAHTNKVDFIHENNQHTPKLWKWLKYPWTYKMTKILLKPLKLPKCSRDLQVWINNNNINNIKKNSRNTIL